MSENGYCYPYQEDRPYKVTLGNVHSMQHHVAITSLSLCLQFSIPLFAVIRRALPFTSCHLLSVIRICVGYLIRPDRDTPGDPEMKPYNTCVVTSGAAVGRRQVGVRWSSIAQYEVGCEHKSLDTIRCATDSEQWWVRRSSLIRWYLQIWFRLSSKSESRHQEFVTELGTFCVAGFRLVGVGKWVQLCFVLRSLRGVDSILDGNFIHYWGKPCLARKTYCVWDYPEIGKIVTVTVTSRSEWETGVRHLTVRERVSLIQERWVMH